MKIFWRNSVKTPKGMNEQEVIDTIVKVVDRYAKKFKFSYHEIDDIKQEGFMIGMEALGRYDPSRPLENFLAVHIKNRLKNFRRDNFFKPDETLSKNVNSDKDMKKLQRNNVRMFLLYPIDIDAVKQDGESNMSSPDEFINDIEIRELMRIIDINLGVSYRKDYLKIKDGIYVSKVRREEIYDEINRILEEKDG